MPVKVDLTIEQFAETLRQRIYQNLIKSSEEIFVINIFPKYSVPLTEQGKV